jgi:hypothetical protein
MIDQIRRKGYSFNAPRCARRLLNSGSENLKSGLLPVWICVTLTYTKMVDC